MNALPIELKQHICGFLHDEDLPSVRAVNSTWSHVAACRLFREITITPLSLERLRLIAQHELIATCVKRIILHVDLLPLVLPEMWHEGLIRSQFTHTPKEEAFAFRRYVLAYRVQQRLRENDYKLNREIMDLSIPMLRKLLSLKLVVQSEANGSNQSNNSSRQNQQWFKVWDDLTCYALDIREAFRPETDTFRQMTNLLKTLANSDVHIQRLSLRSRGWQRILLSRQEPPCGGLTALKTLFLDTSVFYNHLHSTADAHCNVTALGKLLEGAQNLQTLKLHENPCQRPQIDILQYFRPSLPKLSWLNLYGIAASEQDLIDFLLAFRATLAILYLGQVSLAGGNTGQLMGSWHQVFRRVSGEFLYLNKIRLRSLHYLESGPQRWRRSRVKLESAYLKSIEHAILKGTDIPQST